MQKLSKKSLKYRKLFTSSKSMTCVQAYTDTRLVCDKVYDLFQLRELAANSITLATHVLNNYSKCANDKCEEWGIQIIKIQQPFVNLLIISEQMQVTTTKNTSIHQVW